MSIVYIDGKEEDSANLDPARHVYVGKFRKPFNDFPSGGGYVCCPCGQILQTRDQSYQHWDIGHWDALVYRTTGLPAPTVEALKD